MKFKVNTEKRKELIINKVNEVIETAKKTANEGKKYFKFYVTDLDGAEKHEVRNLVIEKTDGGLETGILRGSDAYIYFVIK